MQRTRRFSEVISAVALCALCFVGPSAHSQGVSAQASIKNTSPEAEIKLLRQLVSALEGRVHELEKKAEDVKNNTDEDAQAKKIEQRLTAIEQELHREKAEVAKNDTQETNLEQRLAAIEQQQAKPPKDAARNPAQSASGNASSRVKAPFVVYDDIGHEVLRVELNSETKAPRMVLGNPSGAHVLLAANDTEKISGLQLYVDKDKIAVALRGEKAHAYVGVIPPEGGHSGYLGNRAGEFGLYLSSGNIESVKLASRDAGEGFLGLADASGEIMVDAGTSPEGVGLVRTGPQCCAPPGAGPHEYLRGKKKK